LATQKKSQARKGLVAGSRKQSTWETDRTGPQIQPERHDVLFASLFVDTPIAGDTTYTVITVPAGFKASLVYYYILVGDSDLEDATITIDEQPIRSYSKNVYGTTFSDNYQWTYDECPRFNNTLKLVYDVNGPAGPGIEFIVGYILEPQNNTFYY